MAEKNVILKNTAGDVLYPEVAVKNRIKTIDINIEPKDGKYIIDNSKSIDYNTLVDQYKKGITTFFKIYFNKDYDTGNSTTFLSIIHRDDWIIAGGGRQSLHTKFYSKFVIDAYDFAEIVFDGSDTSYIPNTEGPKLFTISITESNSITLEVTETDVLDGTIKDAAIITSKVADKAITTAKLADKAVTAEKLAVDLSTYVTSTDLSNYNTTITQKIDTALSTAKDYTNNLSRNSDEYYSRILNSKEDKTPINNVTATAGGTVTLTANSFTNITMPTAGGTVTIAITAPSATTKSVDYDGAITTGTTIPTITWDSKVKWQADAPTLEAKKRYEFSIRFDGTSYYALMV